MAYESKDKMVSHPDHYKHGDFETIDVIEAFIEGLPAKEAFLTGQVLKYMSRWNSKNGLQDLEKAKWYLDRLIDSEVDKIQKDILDVVEKCEENTIKMARLSEKLSSIKDCDFSHGEHQELPTYTER